MSAFESAIDDSLDPPPQPIEDEEIDDETLFDNAYNGPRDGRWEVGSSVGSFVDDRCPTVVGYRPQARRAGREPRINEGLVKKLMQATVEQKRAEAAARAQQTATVGGAPTDNGHASSPPPSVKAPRPFIVPLLRNEPLGPVMASHVKSREPSQTPPLPSHQAPEASNEFQATATREAAAPKTEVAKAKSEPPRIITPDRSTIRILGKNGEEAFVSLPSLAKSLLAKSVLASSHKEQQRSVSAAPVNESRVASAHETQQRTMPAASINESRGSIHSSQPRETFTVPEVIETKEQHQTSDQQQDQKQDQKQDQNQNQSVKKKPKNNKEHKQPPDEVEQLITDFPQAEGVEPQRATSWVMSGALPAPSREPSRAPSQAAQSPANSLRDSGIAMSEFFASLKHASTKASSIRPESSVSQGVMSIAQQITELPSTTSSARNSKPRSTAVKDASSRACSIRPECSVSQGAMSIAQQIAKIPSTTSSARNSKPKSTASGPEGFKEIGLGMTTGYPPQERTSDRSDRERAKKASSSRHNSQPSVRSHSGSVQQRGEGSKQGSVASSRHSSQPSIRSRSGSVQQHDVGSKQGTVLSSRHSSNPSIRNHSTSVQQQYEGSKQGSVHSSRHSSQPSLVRVSGSVQQQDGGSKQGTVPSSRHSSQPSAKSHRRSVQEQQEEGGMQEIVRSNYKPPTVVSASSSASITHSFGGMFTEGFVPEDQYVLLGQELEIGYHGGGSNQSGSVRSGSVRNSVKDDAPDKSSSKHSQSSSHGHRSNQSLSVRSDRGSSVHSGANYVFDVKQSRSGSQAHHSDHSASIRSDRGSSVHSGTNYISDVKQSRPGSQAHRSDHSSSTSSDKGGSVQSGASHATSVASSRPKKSRFQATSMTSHPRSDQPSQASGTRCPSHSPVSPLASSPSLITPGQEKTKFAGKGWISPHPCSTPVYVSADGPGHVGTLTYSEWRAHREGLKSNAGSYAGSRVPSAVGLEPLPREVYGHPPPASYVGSYNPDPRYSPQPVPQMDGEPAWLSQQFSPLLGANAIQLPSESLHSQHVSSRSQGSAHGQQDSPRSGGPSTSHNNSLYNQPVRQLPIAALQDAGWSFPPQDDRPISDHPPAYNVGLTPSELSDYQRRLGNTISRYSSQLSHVQREQSPPQPDYEVWNSGQSHHSSRRSTSSEHSRSQPSIHNFPPNLSYPRVKSQLAMPWDPTMSQVNGRSAVPVRQVSSPAGSSWRGSVGGEATVGSHLPSNASSSRGSVVSRESFDLADSHVTYGSVAWEKLENAEDGRGAYQAPEGYNMW
jgi:hypothetical protein